MEINKEVKLVLCDMDGTLLNSEKQIPIDFEEVYEGLKKQGVTLAIASGRPFSNVRVKFPTLYHEMSAISENGGTIFLDGKLIYSEKIPKDCWAPIALQAREMDTCSLVVCTLNATYIEDTYDYLVDVAREFYPDLTIIDDLLSVEEEVVKLSLRDFVDTETNTIPTFAGKDERLHYAASDKHWLDIMILGMSKGKGVDVLCEAMNITPDNIMAFGDHFNDYEMLEKVKYSYAMENAHPDIKKICSYQCGSNDENGVMNELRRVFHL